ncbi:MAG TPA: hypothetical protein VET24_12510 [Actinomycetota bacterium]|nr:hypothetical protein [Actinomycetota bacterium]
MSESQDAAGFEVSHIRGNPSPEEETAILLALEAFLGREQQGPGTLAGHACSAWTLAGRLAARRGGILDVRSTLGRSAWAASATIPWSGQAHQGRVGRGESR